jgi:hypothetical protein
MRIESRMHTREVQKTLQQQAGAQQQHHCQSDFACSQRGAQAAVSTLFASGSPPAILQRCRRSDPRSLQSRGETKQNSRQQRNPKGEAQQASVQPDRAQSAGIIPVRNVNDATANTSPSAPPDSPSTRLSASAWHITRLRLAPNAAQSPGARADNRP